MTKAMPRERGGHPRWLAGIEGKAKTRADNETGSPKRARVVRADEGLQTRERNRYVVQVEHWCFGGDLFEPAG
jgi:hypothetical protein